MSYINEPIAIIGTGYRFPGDANSSARLWNLLAKPRDVQSKIDRFRAENFYNADGHRHGTSNVLHAYLLREDPRTFDAQFFNISAAEADSIDPQQRVLLETVYESLENAGMSVESLRGSSTAVYVGVMCDDYTDIVYHDHENIPTYAATGSARSILSNRVSYFFDWHGPSMTIDTACSSSLIAVHQAVQVLRSGESEVAVAGGANLIFGPKMFVAESNLSMLSPTGRSQMWDSNANGYARGEGVAAVVMKTLSKAIADGDHIECIIRETGINQDGRTMGITMPSSDAQCTMIQETYAKAGLNISDPYERCQYFEAHGTGTKAGDPQEARAIFNAFYSDEATRRVDNILHVGSIKTVIGHTEGTAGLAGLIKASLAIQNKTIPPNLLFNNLNPDLEPYYGPLNIPTRGLPWPKLPAGVPRRASVNSFGFGGANAHAILESYDQVQMQPVTSARGAVIPFLISANTEKILDRQLFSHLKFLKENPNIELRDISLTMNRRSALPMRCPVSASTTAELCEKIQSLLDSRADGQNIATRSGVKNPQILGVFTGQGAQWASMGAELLNTFPSVKECLLELEKSLHELPETDRPSWNLIEELQAKADTSRLGEGALSQPLCTAVQITLVDLLVSCGVRFSAVVGHSSGEIAACYAAGFITARDAIRIAYYRGLYAKYARGQKGEKGAMMAAGTSFEDAEELCMLPAFQGRLSVAASNSSASVTLSGDADAIQEATFILEDESKFARKLKVDTAYHSHHMLPCAEHYVRALDNCNIEISCPSEGAPKWYSSVSGGLKMSYTQRSLLQSKYWMNNMLQPVLFSNAVQAAVRDDVEPTFALEVGPHPALQGPASLTIEETLHHGIPYSGTLKRGANDVEAITGCLTTMWANFTGPYIDFKEYDYLSSGSRECQILKTLPSYCWDNDKVYWNESRSSRALRLRQEAHHELLGSRLTNDADGSLSWRNYLKPADSTWLRGHEIQGQKLFPAAGYAAIAIEASKAISTSQTPRLIELEDLRIHQALAFIDEVAGVEILTKLSNVTRHTEHGEDVGSAHYECFACLNKDAGKFTLMTSAYVKIFFGEPTSSALPERLISNIGMTDVDVEEFYSSLVSVGYNYQAAFRGISTLKRAKDMAAGTLISQPEESMDQPYTFHPAPLDVAFQSVFAAIGSPGDGMLWTIHVPTIIKRVSVNCHGIPANGALGAELPFDAFLEQTGASGVSGDVSIYNPEGTSTIVQIEGLHVTPLAAATAANDRKMFQHDVWDVAYPDAETICGEQRPAVTEDEKAIIIERTCLFYLKQMFDAIDDDDRDKCDWHQMRILEWADYVLKQVRDDQHPVLKSSWLEDKDLAVPSNTQYNELDQELELVHEVGRQLIPFIKGEISPDDMYVDRDIVEHFQNNSFGIMESKRSLARLVRQIGHRHQNLTILQIGSGLETTKAILEQIEDNFSYFTYTDTTNEYFEEAADALKAHEKKFMFKVFDPENDVISQNFRENSYDLVVAANVLHTTNHIGNALQNVRSLLRPGGYLALLETTNTSSIRTNFIMSGLPEYWTIEDDRRALTPLADHRIWDSVLRETGFGGIDSTTPDTKFCSAPFSVMVAQAVSPQISLMRQPLAAQPTAIPIENLLLVGGTKLSTSRLRDQISNLLRPFTKSITTAESLQTLEVSMIQDESTVVCLAELDQPLFCPFTDQKLKIFQKLVEKSKQILWVVQGAAGEQPYSNMIIGVARCLVGEAPHVRWQVLDFDLADKPDAMLIAEELLRLKVYSSWNLLSSRPLWTMETELRSSKGFLSIPRCAKYNGPNDRHNSSKREIRKEVRFDTNTVGIVPRGDAFEVQEQLLHTGNHALDNSQASITINVRRSTWYAFKVSDAGYFHLVLGTVENTNTKVLAFSVNQMSTTTVPAIWSVPIDCNEDEEAGIFEAATYHFLTYLILYDLKAEHSVLLHEPDRRLTGALKKYAQEIGITLMLTTCSNERLDCRYVHPETPSRTLHSTLPRSITSFVDLSDNGDSHGTAKRISGVLPRECSRSSLSSLLTTQGFATPGRSSTSIYSTLSALRGATMAKRHLQPASEGNQITLADVPSKNLETNFSTVVVWHAKSSVSVRVVPAENTFNMRSDRTYFLVGLTGSLGLSLCRFMVEHGARHFALTSRNPNVNKVWLQQMQDKGADVKIYAMDVTRRESVESVVRKIRYEMPPIIGVLNGAMVLIDSLLSSHTYEKFSTTLSAKVDGTKFLDEIFTEKDLDFFMAFSSLAYVSGNFGQTSYAAGNAYMTSLVERRRRRGLAGCVMHLAGIYGVGYVERTDRKIMSHLEKYGMSNISEWDFHQCFAEAVAAGRPESGLSADVASTLGTYDPEKDEHVPPWIDSPRFGHFRYIRQETEEANGDSRSSTSMKPRLAEQTTQEGIYDALMDGLKATLARQLHLPSADDISPDQAVVELGVDSLAAVDLRGWFTKELSIDMPVLKILGGATLAEVVADAVKRLPKELTPNFSSSSAPAAAQTSENADSTKTIEPDVVEANKDGATSDNQHEDPESSKEDNGTDSPALQDPESIVTSGNTSDDAATPNLSSGDMSPQSSATSISGHEDESDLIAEKLTDFKITQVEHAGTPEELELQQIDDSTAMVGPLQFVKTGKMSYAATRFWFLDQFLSDPTTFNLMFVMRFNGGIDVEKAKYTVATIGQRHEAFRTAFFTDADNMNQPSLGIMAQSKFYLDEKTIGSDANLGQESQKMLKEPFDLEIGDTARATLFSMDDDKYAMVFVFHHIVMDGFSFNNLLADMNKLYAGEPVPRIVMQYSDFAAHERKLLGSGAVDQEVQFWKDEYPDFPDPLPLFPSAKVSLRQPMQNYDYEEVKVAMDLRSVLRIRQHSRRLKATTFQFVFAAFKTFLFRFLDAKDISIGMADANRTEPGILNTIGFFLNLLPIRFKANEEQTFGEAVAEVRSKVQAALKNSKVPFDVLLEQLNAPRSASHSPLFQAFIDFRQFSGKAPPVLSKEVVAESVVGRTGYDLVLDVTDIVDGSFTISMRGQKYLYSQETMQMLLDSYVRLLHTFSTGKRVLPSKVPIYETRDIKTALALGRGRYLEPQWPSTISHRIDDMMARYSSELALKDDLGNQLSYSSMRRTANMVSNALIVAGIGKNSTVGIFQEPSVNWICSMIGLWRVGATYVPLDTRNGIPRLQSIVQDSNLAAILYHDQTANDVRNLGAKDVKAINFSALDPLSAEYEVENQARPETQAAIIYTSGSTGTPKGIVLPHASMRNEMEAYSQEWHIGREVVLQQSAYSFDFSLDQILSALCNGGTLFIASKFLRENSAQIAQVLVDEGITYTKATPSEYAAWIDQSIETMKQATAWKFAFGGGEAITKALMKDFKDLDLAGLKLLNSYGPAEATLSCVKADLDYRQLADGDEEIAPAGFVLPNYCLQIVDKHLEPLPVGVAGEILIGGAGVSVGYLNDPEMTAAKFLEDSHVTSRFSKQDWTRVYRSGDKGYLREDGALIIQGRIDGDTQIKLRGIRIELTDIENTILRTAGDSIVQVIVSARGNPQFLVAHAKFSAEVADKDQVKFGEDLVSQLPLPPYMRPSLIIPVDAFALNGHNKTDRRAVSQLPLPKHEETSDDDLTETEIALRDIWKPIVSSEIGEAVGVGKKTDFFQAGGNSLLLVKLQALILQHFSVSLPVAKLFGSSSLESMATMVEEAETVSAIDWQAETGVSAELSSQAGTSQTTKISGGGISVLLTGATGYLGSRLLLQLLESESVSMVHTVAVRSPGVLQTALDSSKLRVHRGDLTKSRLGLSEGTFIRLSEEVDVIIHSGANRSFWDQFHLLRGPNVSSTKELANLAAPRKIPIHFLSSGGVMDFVDDSANHSPPTINNAASVRAFTPPGNGAHGYLASKWASEVFLENVHSQLGMPVHIHRVTPAGDSAETTMSPEVLEELGKLAMEMKSLPAEGSGWEGTFDLLESMPLAKTISEKAIASVHGRAETQVEFVHYPGTLRLQLKDIVDEMEEHKEITGDYERVLPHIWIGKAKKLGFSYHVASNDVMIGGGLNLRR